MSSEVHKILFISWTKAHRSHLERIRNRLNPTIDSQILELDQGVGGKINLKEYFWLLKCSAKLILLQVINFGLRRHDSFDFYPHEKSLITRFIVQLFRQLIAELDARIEKMPYEDLRYLTVLPILSGTFGRETIRRVLEGDTFTAIVVPEDNFLYDIGDVVSLAKRYGIKTICLNYSIGVNEELEARFINNSNSLVRKLKFNLVAKYFTKYSKESETGFGWLPISKVIYTEARQCSPIRPWSGYSGKLDRYGLDSSIEVKIALQSVVLPQEITHIMCEESYEVISRRMNLGQIKSPKEKPLKRCLVSLPPDHFSVGPNPMFPNYKIFINELIDLIAFFSGEIEFEFCLHPRLARTEIINDLPKEHLVHETLTEGLINADLFLCFHSATIRVADDCCIPTIDLDLFGYSYARTFCDLNFRHAFFLNTLPELQSVIREFGTIEVSEIASCDRKSASQYISSEVLNEI